MPNPALDDEDEEEQEDAANGNDQSPAPTPPLNMPPAAPGDVDRISKMMAAMQKNQGDADVRSERLAGVAKDIGDEQRRNSFIAGLMGSVAQMGTLGGKAPTAAPVGQMAQGLDQASQGQYADMLRASDRADKRAAVDARLIPYLARAQTQKRFGATPFIGDDGQAYTIDQTTGQPVPLGIGAQKLSGPPKPDAPGHFQVVGTDENGNLQVMNSQTGEITTTDKKGQKLGGPPKPGAGGLGDKDERTYAQKAAAAAANDKDLKDANGTLSAITEARGLIDSAATNPTSANALAPVLARILSHGQRINMPEIESMEGGSKAFWDRIQTLQQRAESGTITPDQARYLKGTLSTLEAGAAGISKDREQAHVDAYRSYFPNTPEDQIRTRLMLRKAPAGPTTAATGPGTGPGGIPLANAGLQPSPPPHGMTVQQGDTTFKWNGFKYVAQPATASNGSE